MAEPQPRDLVLDDRDAALDLRSRSFGPLAADSLPWWEARFEETVTARRMLGVFEGDLLVGAARLHEYRQLWGGRAVPMAGVAGVVVAPERRGRGVATTLLTAVLDRGIELGDVVSVLFPAALPPYRRLGWELAGAVSRTTFAADALRGLGAAPRTDVRRATADDVEEVARLLREDAERSRACGPLELSHDEIRELLTDDDNICYLAADGVVVYAWDDKDLRVERMAAASAATTRSLWSLVGSGSSWVRQVYTYLSAHDPIHWVIDGKANLEVEEDRWMLRLLDASAAVAGRGFPLGVTVELPLVLDDPWLARCAGSFRLQVDGGSGVLVPASDLPPETTRLGPNGLAAMYAGTPLPTLRAAGLVTGGRAEHDAMLDAAFASRCYLIDSF